MQLQICLRPQQLLSFPPVLTAHKTKIYSQLGLASLIAFQKWFSRYAWRTLVFVAAQIHQICLLSTLRKIPVEKKNVLNKESFTPVQLCLSFREELIADKRGIEITSTPESEGGKVVFSLERLKEVFIVRFHIANKGSSCVYFTYYTALHKIRCFTLEDDHSLTRVNPLILCPGTAAIFVSFRAVSSVWRNSLDNNSIYFYFFIYFCCRRKLWSQGSLHPESLWILSRHHVLWVRPWRILSVLHHTGDGGVNQDPTDGDAGTSVSLQRRSGRGKESCPNCGSGGRTPWKVSYFKFQAHDWPLAVV